jgi:hypothetical protein
MTVERRERSTEKETEGEGKRTGGQYAQGTGKSKASDVRGCDPVGRSLFLREKRSSRRKGGRRGCRRPSCTSGRVALAVGGNTRSSETGSGGLESSGERGEGEGEENEKTWGWQSTFVGAFERADLDVWRCALRIYGASGRSTLKHSVSAPWQEINDVVFPRPRRRSLLSRRHSRPQRRRRCSSRRKL